MNIITGRTGNPHITSQQMRDTNIAVIGKSDCVLNVGRNFAAEQLDSNTIRIHDGQLSLQGCIASIDAGEYEDFTIENGSIGYERIDYIVAHYRRIYDSDNNLLESVNLEVEKCDISTPIIDGAQSIPKEYENSLTIREGAINYYFRLYAIFVKNLNIESIVPMYQIFNESSKWMDVTYSSLFQNYSDVQKLLYRKSGNLIEIRGEFKPKKTIIDSAEQLIGYIDESCAPSSDVRKICQGSGAGIWLFTIKPNGELRFSKFQIGGTFHEVTENTRLAAHAIYLLG